MADKIKVSTGEMRLTIGKYTKSRHTMEDARRKMASALHNLNGCWRGLTWAAMMDKWVEINSNIVKSELAVDRSIASLYNTIALYETAEDTNKDKANSMDVGTRITNFVS